MVNIDFQQLIYHFEPYIHYYKMKILNKLTSKFPYMF